MLYRIIAVSLVAVLLRGNLIAQTETQPQLQTLAKMQQVL